MNAVTSKDRKPFLRAVIEQCYISKQMFVPSKPGSHKKFFSSVQLEFVFNKCFFVFPLLELTFLDEPVSSISSVVFS